MLLIFPCETNRKKMRRETDRSCRCTAAAARAPGAGGMTSRGLRTRTRAAGSDTGRRRHFFPPSRDLECIGRTFESLLHDAVQIEEQVGALLLAGVASRLHQGVQFSRGHGAQVQLRARSAAQQDACGIIYC